MKSRVGAAALLVPISAARLWFPALRAHGSDQRCALMVPISAARYGSDQRCALMVPISAARSWFRSALRAHGSDQRCRAHGRDQRLDLNHRFPASEGSVHCMLADPDSHLQTRGCCRIVANIRSVGQGQTYRRHP